MTRRNLFRMFGAAVIATAGGFWRRKSWHVIPPGPRRNVKAGQFYLALENSAPVQWEMEGEGKYFHLKLQSLDPAVTFKVYGHSVKI
jgi:hypothetical protein